jgi:phage terminase large subunit-like protein
VNRAEFLGSLSECEHQHLLRWWDATRRDDQRDPTVPIWLVLGGRGSGKTRAGAEWILDTVRAGARRIALVAPTLHTAREVMLGGESGLLSIGYRNERPVFQPTRRRLLFPNGAEGLIFSAFEPDSLRGSQFDAAWGDELCAWADPEAALSNLRMGLRLGANPRLCLTTTPRPIPLLDQLMAEPGCVVTNARTRDNAAQLSKDFISQMETAFGGTALGRQELDGEIVRDHPGAVFQRPHIDAGRVESPPALSRILVAIDPPATSHARSDACGIMVVGVTDGDSPHAYVLHDGTLKRAEPLTWAQTAIALAHELGAEAILAETNQGGEMVAATLAQVDPDLPVLSRHARRSKRGRAVPVALLYARGRVHHVGRLDALEDEMCAFGSPAQSGSPDRVDALVWAVSELLLSTAAPRLTFL